MKTAIIQSKTITHSTLTLLVLALIFIALLPNQVSGAGPTHPPVPTYGPATLTPGAITATIPANLAKEWRGIYSIETSSVLTYSHPETLQKLFKSALVGQENPVNTIKSYQFNPKAIYAWTGQIASTVNATTAEPKLKIENDRAVEFTPPTMGRALDRYDSTFKIIEALQEGRTTVELVAHTTSPETKLGELNNLGITELVGRGESKFDGSPKNRRHNIRIGVEKMKGIIIKPGDEFSFNKYLGPVEAYTGFLPELVIKKTGTVPEFGGGLCQVSSTAFRAAMHAGLPITQRRNHSYAVQYYAPQGTDATIYPGVIDLKFLNDTDNSILVWPHFITENHLVFDFYGTYDGREVKLGTPSTYDRKSDGSMKSTWTRTVIKDGKMNKDTFNSVYQPPALFHRQETFASAPGTTPSSQPAGGPTSPTPSASPTKTETSPDSKPSPTVIDPEDL